ncbi:MAG TPA: AraC family transcriptional regulator [Actinomycetota bacterium]|nr:AraC family transcriptional regulator [Actinomycetota bacterium]
MDVDIGTGLVRTLAESELTRVGVFRHGPGAHRDPSEEAFDADTVILPLAGAWWFHGAGGRREVGHGVLVAGRGGSCYGAGHDDDRPDDRALFVQVLDRRSVAPDGIAERAFAHDVVPRTERLGRVAAELWDEIRGDDPDRVLAIDLLAMRLSLELARTAEAPSRIGPRSPAADAAADAARIHLETRYADPIDMAELSRVALMSPFHLARAFRARIGTSPHRYLIEVRLRAAEALLRGGDLTVSRIAERTGFGSPSHLGRRFVERYGMQPSIYRRTFGRGRSTDV